MLHRIIFLFLLQAGGPSTDENTVKGSIVRRCMRIPGAVIASKRKY